MIRVHVFLLFSTLLFSNCAFFSFFSTKNNSLTQQNSAIANPTGSSQKIRFSIENALPAQEQAQLVSIRYDHYFRTAKQYRGFPVAEILINQIRTQGVDTTGAMVVFECTDGYRPVMDLWKVLGDKQGYVVYKDASAPAGLCWPDSLAARFTPYYLVWADVSPSDHQYTWPYGLAHIEIVPGTAEFKSVFPADRPEVARGFSLFRENCMKCHSVSQIGGTMGPELNAPKNITEYWRADDIIAFAKKPTSFRSNSKMPPMEHLSEEELKEIVRYLEYLADKNDVQTGKK
jgi:mono/diheme cytochrome c family protein